MLFHLGFQAGRQHLFGHSVQPFGEDLLEVAAARRLLGDVVAFPGRTRIYCDVTGHMERPRRLVQRRPYAGTGSQAVVAQGGVAIQPVIAAATTNTLHNGNRAPGHAALQLF